MRIDDIVLERALGRRSFEKFACETMGLVDATLPDTLSFLDDERYLARLISNPNVTAAFVVQEFLPSLQKAGKVALASEDPRHDFYSLQNYLSEVSYTRWPSRIHETAIVHPAAHVCEHNVVLGARCVVEANATILSDVELGEDCVVRAGAVIGSEGFEHKRTTRGVLSVRHDGRVVIGSRVHVGSGTCIAKGFAFRDTIIGDDCKMDNLVHIAHGVHVGRGCFFPACAMVAGSVTIEEDVWIGPGSSLSSGLCIRREAYITIGSVVTREVGPGERVTGNFAIPHEKFLRELKRMIAEK